MNSQTLLRKEIPREVRNKKKFIPEDRKKKYVNVGNKVSEVISVLSVQDEWGVDGFGSWLLSNLSKQIKVILAVETDKYPNVWWLKYGRTLLFTQVKSKISVPD